MVMLCFLLLLLQASSQPTFSETQTHSNGVIILASSNFTQILQQHHLIVVQFYAPWCGHCQDLAPEYEKAAAALKSHDPPIRLAKVDAEAKENKELAKQYGVDRYPTLKIFRNKGTVVQDYRGPKNDVEGIVSYISKQAGPSSQEITSAEDGAKLFEENDIVIVGVFRSFDTEEFRSFKIAADRLRSECTFAHTSNLTFLPAKDRTPNPPFIRMFKKFDEGFNDLQEFSFEAIRKFVEVESMPLVVMLDQDASKHPYVMKFFTAPESKVLLFLNLTADSAKDYTTVYRELAQSYKGKGLIFLLGDSGPSNKALQYFGLQADKLPTIVLQIEHGKVFILEQVEAGKLASWLKNYSDDLLEFVKAEPISEEDDELVKVIMTDTLQDMVLNSGKNVLLEFYAPWCGYCIKLAPVLEEIAEFFESEPDVVIAKMDGTANDIRRDLFEVKGYPTMCLFTASGNIIYYKGHMSKEDIIEFIKKNKDSAGKIEILKGSTGETDGRKDEL